MAESSIQKKSRFKVAEGELRNSTVGEGGILVSYKNSVKKVGGILAATNSWGVVSLSNH